MNYGFDLVLKVVAGFQETPRKLPPEVEPLLKGWGVERLRGQVVGDAILIVFEKLVLSLTVWHGLSSLTSTLPSSPKQYFVSHTIPDEPCLLYETPDLCKVAILSSRLTNLLLE